MKSPVLIALALFLAPAAAPAQTPPPPAREAIQAPTLKVGDKAPALTVEKWVKGAPVASFEKGKVYMVEFWATWCGPCIRGMPHVTELQKTYKDKGLTVIGMTSLDSRGNTLEAVEKMVADKGDEVLGYSVAWDKDRTTNEAFMKAAGQGGIPCAFLIDREGYVAFIGHPMEIDATLADVIAGKHDLKALAAAQAKAKEIEARAGALDVDLNKAARASDWEKVVQLLDELIALDAKQFGGAAVKKFSVLAGELKDPTRAFAYANQVLQGIGKSDANLLNAIAWTMVDPEKPLAQTDADLAIKLATRATELTQRKNAGVLDTLARAHFVKGEVERAIEIQMEAVKLDKDLQGTLDEYKAAKEKQAKN